jgi:uncharacterized protein (DUF1330 family)
MSYERLMGLQVVNEVLYQAYREAMMPILKRYGGGFRYDFKIRETLLTEADHEINRVFIICFKDLESQNAFYDDPEYKAIRQKYFEPAIPKYTVISEYIRSF